MKNFRKIFVYVMPISFVLGILWGLKLIDGRHAQPRDELRVLAYKDSLPEPIFHELFRKTKIVLKVDWVDSPLQWQKSFLTDENNYDLVFIYHFQLEALISQGLLEKIPPKAVKNAELLSSDFKFIPGVSDAEFAPPVSWGFLGYIFNNRKVTVSELSWSKLLSLQLDQKIALRSGLYEILSTSWMPPEVMDASKTAKKKTAVPEPAYISESPLEDVLKEQAWLTFSSQHEFAKLKNDLFSFAFPEDNIPYWILAVGAPARSQKKSSAWKVMDFLLSDKAAGYFAEAQLPTAVRSMNEKPVADFLKPSYLRHLPLRKLTPAQSYWLF